MRTISVVIPTYNRAQYITEAIDSVLVQKLPEGWRLEIIIADDGSTDNTKQVLKPYVTKKLVKYYMLSHSGKPAVPRNYAIRKATGELIAFQDSDDIWPKDKLQKQIPIFDKKDVVLVYGNAEIIKEDGKKTGKLVVSNKSLSGGTDFGSLIESNVISTLTVVAKKEAIVEVGMFSEEDSVRVVEDYELWMKISARYPKQITYLTDILAYYRTHDKNFSSAAKTETEVLLWLQNAYYSLYEYGKISPKQNIQLRKQTFEIAKNIDRVWTDELPLVSVVMSVFNGKEFLRPAIEGILNQTFKDFEFIIIDDGSTDESVKIIKSYKDKRIRLIQQRNHGLVFSLNKGIGLSRGKYIARQDADDISLPTRFEQEVKWLEAEKERGLVSTYFELIDYKTSKPNGIKLVFPIGHTDLRRTLYVTNPFPHGASMYRKKAFLDLGGYIDTYGPTEDYELWRRLAEKWEVSLVPEVLYQYRINNPESMSQKDNTTQNLFIKKIRDELWQKPFISKSPQRVKKDLLAIKKQVKDSYVYDVEREYKSLQYALTKELLLRGKIKRATIQAAGLALVYPKGFFDVLKFAPRGLAYRVKNQIRKNK